MQTKDWSSEVEKSTLFSVPVLTIVSHPDLHRVGERAVLSGLVAERAVGLGRDEPAFAPPGRPPRHALAAACVSRTPILLEPLPGDGIRIRCGESRTKLEHRGAVATGDIELTAADVERGAVLRLGGLIVLLLHHALPGSTPSRDAFGLVGDSDGIERVRRDIARVADLEVPVLLRGETGTGKEVVAHGIHQASARREGPFVAVNLGAISPELAAAELFGAERGSFTGAVKQQEGYFSAARGGTLFLDEIGEAPVALQALLLRALQTGEIQRVGASRAQQVDVRVIAATDADIEARMTGGSFRAPLYHRLSACEIWIPPLRERRDDIGRLLLTFLRAELASVGEEHRLAASESPWLPASFVARLAAHDWPGNVRQLQNVARQLVLAGRGRDRIEITAGLERLFHEPGAPPASMTPPPPSSSMTPPVSSSWAAPPATQPPPPVEPAGRRKPADVTSEELIAALRESRWELATAAEVLRISRASMYVLVERNEHLRRAGDLTAEELTRTFEECGGDLSRMVASLEVSEKALRRRLRELGLI